MPQLETALQSALTGTEGHSCVDAHDNTVCKVYSITITNTGTSSVTVPGTLTLTSEATHLKWRRITDAKTLGSNAAVSAGTAGAIDTPNLAPNGETGASQTYYVVVWLEETKNAQDTPDAGKPFTGTVSFELESGTGVTSTFTA